MYKYQGDIATHVCPNGHMGAYLNDCPVCGATREPLQLLTETTRLPVSIIGYYADGSAAVRDTNGKVEEWPENFVVKWLCCPAVIDWPLLAGRLFSWGVVTGK